MKLNRRSFLSAVAAFIVGVQAEVFSRDIAIRPPKPKRAPTEVLAGQVVCLAANGKCAPYFHGLEKQIPIGIATHAAKKGEIVFVLLSSQLNTATVEKVESFAQIQLE